MYKLIQKRVIPLQCKRCSHMWEYSGKNVYFATCPYCKTCVNIRKQLNIKTKTTLENESEIGTLGSFSKVTQPKETPVNP